MAELLWLFFHLCIYQISASTKHKGYVRIRDTGHVPIGYRPICVYMYNGTLITINNQIQATKL